MQDKPTLRAALRLPWITAFLSLDIVHQFYDMMGLDPKVHASIHQTCVGVILRTRELLLQSLVNDGPKPTPERVCEYIEGRLGPETTDHLIWWLMRLFPAQTKDHVPLRDWMYVLRHCHREGDKTWLELGIPGPLSAEVATRFGAAIDLQKYRARSEELEAKPLSDWDLHLYAAQLLSFDDDLEGAGIDVQYYVMATAQAYQAYRFWDWLLRSLDDVQQACLRENALRVVSRDELISVKDLVHPITLGIGI